MIAGALMRLGTAVVGATAMVYALVVLSPGDASACGDLGAAPSYLSWLSHALVLDLGVPCFGPAGTVWGLMVPAALRTLGLVSAAMILAAAFAVPLARLELSPRPAMRWLGAGLGSVGALPAFVWAYLGATGVNLAFADCMRHADCPDWFPVQSHDSWLRAALGAAVLAIGSGTAHDLARHAAAELERARRADWVLFARAAGQPPHKVLARALTGPLLVALLARAAIVLGGAVVVEGVLGLRGLGTLTWEAARFRDLQVLLGVTAAWAALLGLLRLASARASHRPALEEASA